MMCAILNYVEDVSWSRVAIIFPPLFLLLCVTTQVFQHSCGKYSPDVGKQLVGG